MAGELVSLLATICVASTTVSCSHGLLLSLLASTLATIPEDHLFNGATLSDDLELTTADASWTTAARDVAYSTDGTATDLATTAEQVTSEASWATTATETQLRTDNIVLLSVTTTERTASDTFWVTAATDATRSTRSLGAWSAWSACSSPCDGGMQNRVRVKEVTTDAGILEASDIDTGSSRLCNVNLCQVEVTEESYGVYIDFRTTLSTEQYVQIRNHIRAGVGWEIIRFCNSSNNFATCCAGQKSRAPLAHSQLLLDSIVVKRAASPQNDSTLMRLFLVVMANATLSICQDPESSTTTASHSVARRSAQKEQLYMAPTVLSRLLESGSLAQTITSTIETNVPNVVTVFVASRPGASAASLPETNNVTSSPRAKSCGALMEFSLKDQQCMYTVTFYVVIASPSVALLIIVVVIISACKLRRRRFQWTSRGRGGSRDGSRGRTLNLSKEQTNSDTQRRYVHLGLSSRGPDDAHAIVKQDSLTQICDSNDNLNGIYENVTTFRSECQAREPPVFTDVTSDASQPRSPPLLPPQPECGAEDAGAYMVPFENSDELQQTIALPLATAATVVDSGVPAAQALSKRLTQGEYVYIAAGTEDFRPTAAAPTASAALPERDEYSYAVRMSEIDSEYANIVEEGQAAIRHSVIADGNIYVTMG